MNLHIFSDIYWTIRGKIRFYKEVRAYYLRKPSIDIFNFYNGAIERLEKRELSELFDEKDRRLWDEVCTQAIHHMR